MTGKELYYRETSNDPSLHLNNFPKWEELTETQKAFYNGTAANLTSTKKSVQEVTMNTKQLLQEVK